MNEVTPKQASWLEQCKKIIAVLREGDTVAEQIMGIPVSDQNEPQKEPSTMAEKLTDELRTALILAECLSNQVRRISEQF